MNKKKYNMKKVPYKKNKRIKKKIIKKFGKKLFKKQSLINYIFINFIFKIIKLISLFFIFYILKYCKNYDNYAKNMEDYYYKERMHFLKIIKKHYNESKLITFPDYINWLAIHDVTKLKGKCADKILLHEFSKKVLKKDICNKILKVYDNPQLINISELPDQFVLKTNHGSTFNIIVHNKTELDINKAKEQLSDWLNIDYGKGVREFHYSLIKRRTFAEEYLGKDVNNFKFFCYSGIPRFTYIHQNIDGKKYRTFFDMNWNPLDFECDYPTHPTAVKFKPKKFELMKKLARKLSKPFIFVRVDFYEYKDEVRLGELTFAPMSGYYNCKEENEIELGKYFKLFSFKSKILKWLNNVFNSIIP